MVALSRLAGVRPVHASITLVALLLGSSALVPPAEAVCTIDKSNFTATCTGDLSAGAGTLETIALATVENLTTDVAPAAGVSGISVLNAGPNGGNNSNGGAAGAGAIDWKASGFSVSASNAYPVSVRVIGGKGGNGTGVLANSNKVGQPGGTGGLAAAASATFDGNAASLASDVPNLATLLAFSGGGDGGAGANPGSFPGGTGGAGGAGGASRGASLTVGNATIGATASGSGTAFPLLVQSWGGSGGAGAEPGSNRFTVTGGSGGAGGSGGPITAEVGGATIEAEVVDTPALLLQSLGGAGGLGGQAFSTNNPFDMGTAIGGAGGGGGDGAAASLGGSVTITRNAAVNGSDAVRIESVGGTGGDGGDADATLKAVGGDGGRGGSGGEVSLGSAANPFVVSIANNGANAKGLYARSFGATGGQGGVGTAEDGKGGATLGNGPGGAVSLVVGGAVATSGNSGDAVIAQSVGGFDGPISDDGGSVGFGAGTQSGGGGGSVTISLAAAPGADSAQTISTSGDVADAVLALSVGGGGGKAFADDTSVKRLGAEGEANGGGGAVSVTTSLSRTTRVGLLISTSGQNARGIHAASIGGGGGHGGSLSQVQNLGAASGTGGAGGAVTIANIASVKTSGDHSDALFASSVGAGGGSAVSELNVFRVGGEAGSAGGAGGDVTVTTVGGLVTEGSDADAVFAQSVGGGGGKGGSVVSLGITYAQGIGGAGGTGADGGTVEVLPMAEASGQSIETSDDRARGIAAQSIGGGGGHGGNALTVATGGISVSQTIGGAGGGGGNGGKVTVTAPQNITTKGKNATAVLAHSVGGGGGSSGNALGINADSLIGVDLTVGGAAGSGGSGSSVAVTASGLIETKDDLSSGIAAQSLGGGGGHGGTAISAQGAVAFPVSVTHGGSGGDGGDGDSVSVTANEVIVTNGAHAHGVLAHSIGGGGGHGGSTLSADILDLAAVSVTTGGRGGAGGQGGEVMVSTRGTLSTKGHNAAGIVAASIGGGGGGGGATLTANAISGGSVGVTVGGRGGAGGAASAVSVTAGPVSTEGHVSAGILAESVANGGGSSGLVFSATGTTLADVNIAVGGDGGGGSTSGAVSVTALEGLTTAGSFSPAVAARSVGGNGGSAAGTVTTSALTMGAVTVGVGGGGGAGGGSGAVSVTTEGEVTTLLDHGHAIVAQSIGGGGGSGGFSAQGDLTAGEVTVNAQVAVGGGGGLGGFANDSTVKASGSIATNDYRSVGILAQSIGGHGGDGGAVYSGNASLSSTGGGSLGVAVGGGGGSGGLAQEVMVTNDASIQTASFDSVGILAQSIGGNGGFGGSSYTGVVSFSSGSTVGVQVDVGGSGGSGHEAGKVVVQNSGEITSAKGGATGIHAQSIGGGGGRAGNAANIDVDITRSTPGTSVRMGATVGVGGSGGTAGDGDSVTVSNTGKITTGGAHAKGIVAQSVGGGGGDGGTASSYSLRLGGTCVPFSGNNAFTCKSPDGNSVIARASLAVDIGGSGGAAGNGGSASVTNGADAEIKTAGKHAHAIVAHSVGGGGGTGGEGDVGLGGWTTNKTIDSIAKLGRTFTSLPSWTDVSVGVGGSGGASGDGGNVTVTNAALLSTAGDHAFGVHAQSVGGGGGNAGAGATGVWGDVTVGGRGSGGGTGGTVEVTNSGQIATRGEGGVGIFAQSVGGGGGTAGDVEKGFAAPWENLNLGVGVGVQQDAGNGGDGGAVTVSSGAITTTGSRSHGIVAQSVGGSGGIAQVSGELPNVALTYVGSTGDSGDGGLVTIKVNEAVRVSGTGAQGIAAQSASGTGSGNKGGGVILEVSADIEASGSEGRAILVQSAGKEAADNGQIQITIDEGATVSTGSDGAETIGILGGAGNVVTNHGTLVQANPNSYVVRTDGTGTTTLDNYGTVSGSLLVAGTGSLLSLDVNNKAGGRFASGENISLSENSTFVNDGLLSPAGFGSVGTSIFFLGQFQQTASGSTQIDIDFADNSSDEVKIVTESQVVQYAGTIVPNPVGGSPRSGSSGSFGIIEGLSFQGTNFSDLTVASTATVTYGLDKTSEDVNLTYSVDYSPDGVGLSGNQARVGDYVDSLIGVRVTADGAAVDAQYAFVDDLTAMLLTTEEVDTLKDIYDRLGPAEIFAPVDAALFSSLRFDDRLRDCPKVTDTRNVIWSQEGSCGWLSFDPGALQRQRDSNSIDYDETFFGISAGGQLLLSDGLLAGLAFTYEDTNLSNERVSGEGYRVQAGVVVKQEIGATTLSASFSGGLGNYDLSRSIVTPDGTSFVNSDPNTNWIAGHLRGAHRVGLDKGLFLEPSFDVGVTRQWQGAYQETGDDTYALAVDSFANTTVTLNPEVAFGGDFRLLGLDLEASARAGVLAIPAGRERSNDVAFLGAGDGPGFRLTDTATPVLADVGLDLQAAVLGNALVTLSFDSLQAPNQQEYAGTARVSILF